MQLAYILGKNPGKNPTFPKRSVSSSPPKFLMTSFLVINSDFSNFDPFIDQKLRKQQLIPYFFSKKHSISAKTLENMYFPGKFKKNQRNHRSFEKTRKNP